MSPTQEKPNNEVPVEEEIFPRKSSIFSRLKDTVIKHKILSVGLALVIVILIGVVGYMVYKNHHKTSVSTATSKSIASAKSTNQSSDPSGESIPTNPPPGYQQVFAEDFNASSLDSNWYAYPLKQANPQAGYWNPSHIVIGGGLATIKTYEDPADNNAWTSAGMSSKPGLVQTYGEYLVRSRITSSVGVSFTELLWDATNTWSPEVDFSESNGTNTTAYANLLWANRGDQQHAHTTVDLTQWHTWGVIWTSSSLQFTLDGKVWATMDTPGTIPNGPMVLDLQGHTWSCNNSFHKVCPNSSTPPVSALQVDWVVAYHQN
ncbi:MAG TPA: family 16 glycosylhydrolase [Candidatus Saccharimonadales bacterium]|nr:family 16 glycosylhydrolase [Candidatus Saccharimonadales bacterium]